MKKFFKIFVLCSLVCVYHHVGFCERSNNAYKNQIVAIVNGKIITHQQLKMEVAPLVPRVQTSSQSLEDFQQKIAQVEKEVLEGIINRELIVESFYAKGGRIAKIYIEREYESFIAQHFDGDRVKFIEYLQSYGKSTREFKKELIDQSISQFLMNNLYKTLPDLDIEEAKEFYEQHINEFRSEKLFNLRQIVISKHEGKEDECAKKALDLMEYLRTGVDFNTAAKEYNDMPSAFDIGKVSISDLHPIYIDAIQTIKIGTYTKLIETDKNFVVLFLLGTEEERTMSFDEAKNGIINYLTMQKQTELKLKWIEKLRSKASIQMFM